MPTLPPNVNAAPPHHPLPPHLGYMPHPLPPLAHAGFDVTDSDPASSVASPSGASSCSYGSSLLPPRFEDFLSSGPTASEIFIGKMENLVDDTQLLHVLDGQRHMLTRFEKTNEMLLNFNALSAGRYENAAVDFRRHTALLLDMKRELDSVFRRIRALKSRLGKVYPEAFRVCSDVYNMDDLLEEEEEEEEEDENISTHAVVSPQEPQPQPPAPQPVLPDLRRRRSRSFPNSAFNSTLSSADSSTGPLEAVSTSDAVPVEVVNDDDRFEEVNVRSRQSVPEGESSTQLLQQQQQQQPPQSRGPEDRRIGDSTERDESKSASAPKAKLVSSRQVFSHEERPCGSVNYVTSPTVGDPRFDSPEEKDGKGRNVGETGINYTDNSDSARTTTIKDDTVAKTKMDPNVSAIAVEGEDQAQSDSLTRKPVKDSKRPKSHQPSQSRASLQHQQSQSSNKPRPKSLPKSTDSQDDSPAYDVSLSKMASETHRFISEGVAAAAAAAVDAVLTHTAVAAAAGKDGIGGPAAAATGLSKESSASTTTPSAGRKVKPGYGVYQPPRRRGESLDENIEERPS